MKIETRDGSKERKILIGMIVDTSVLAKISARWEKDLFKSKYSNKIAQWCVTYYEKYNKAPGRQIESLYQSWADKARDTETTRLIDKLLSSLSNQYKRLAKESNSDYISDLASDYFNEIKLSRLADAIQGDLAKGDITKAWERTQTIDKVEVGKEGWIDILRDTAAMKRAFKSRNECLIKYPGDLGIFFGRFLARDCFLAIWGHEKAGKSFTAQELAFTGMLQNNKVAYFEVGDLSESQVMRRFMVKIAKRPLDACEYNIPIKIEKEALATTAEVEHVLKIAKRPLNLKRTSRMADRIITRKLHQTARVDPNDVLFRLSVHPNDTISVNGIKAILEVWARQGWVPDIVVIDYADILAPNYGRGESREQTNSTWKGMRSLSQKYHCLMITPTQTDADSYEAPILTKSNFSEDKRKLAHVTATLGLNATEDENEVGIKRLNWIVLREGKFKATKCVHVAGCLEIANPFMLSTF